MSYLNQAHDPRRRATAIVTVGAVHALLAAGLLTGLTVQFIGKADAPVQATNIPLDSPKPEPTPTPTPSPVVDTYIPPVPLPPIPLAQEPDLTLDDVKPQDTAETSLYPTNPGPIVQPDPPRPAPSFIPKRPAPRNGSNWITDNDYPRRALIDHVEGSAGYRLVIGANGRVSDCQLTRPTGNRALDDATCRLISDRARFDPATDENGTKVQGTFTGSVRWQIPD